MSAFMSPDSARKLAQEGLVDVVVDTNLHREQSAPDRVGEAIWIRSHFETMRLGELRIGLEDGRIDWFVDRKIDMDDQLPADPALLDIEEAARHDIRRTQQQVFGP
jgi:hypothetical protein